MDKPHRHKMSSYCVILVEGECYEEVNAIKRKVQRPSYSAYIGTVREGGGGGESGKQRDESEQFE